MLCCWGRKDKSKNKNVAKQHGSDELSSADRTERPTSAGQVHPDIEPHYNVPTGQDTHERCEQELSSLGDAISRQSREIQDLKKTNFILLTRLSAIASAKLTDGNANIADLSDENRPTKIAERFSELHDNEWTDAYDVLTIDNKRSDEDAILTLLKLLCIVYITCRNKATQDLNEMTKMMKQFHGGLDPSKEILKQLKDQRKKKFRCHIHALKANLKVDVRILLSERKERKERRMKMFLKKCLELCWLMAIQDPQVYIDTTIKCSGELHDRNTLRPYTRSGKYIDYIVWPALYLHENGNLLGKGVAQCKTETLTCKVAHSDSEQQTEHVEETESDAGINTIEPVSCKTEHNLNRGQGSTDRSDAANTDAKPSTSVEKGPRNINVEEMSAIMLSTVSAPEKEQPKTDLINAKIILSASETTMMKAISRDNDGQNSPLSASKSTIIYVESIEKRYDSVSDSSKVNPISLWFPSNSLEVSNTNLEDRYSSPTSDGIEMKVLKPKRNATTDGKNKKEDED